METTIKHSVATVGKIKTDAYQCDRCGHVWLPREATIRDGRDPVICPKCKSAYWNRPRSKEARGGSGGGKK